MLSYPKIHGYNIPCQFPVLKIPCYCAGEACVPTFYASKLPNPAQYISSNIGNHFSCPSDRSWNPVGSWVSECFHVHSENFSYVLEAQSSIKLSENKIVSEQLRRGYLTSGTQSPANIVEQNSFINSFKSVQIIQPWLWRGSSLKTERKEQILVLAAYEAEQLAKKQMGPRKERTPHSHSLPWFWFLTHTMDIQKFPV